MPIGVGSEIGGTPYTGGHGWVPTMGITRGAGAPHAPAVTPPPSLAQQANQIGALTKALTSPGNPSAPLNLSPPGVGASPVGVGPVPFSPTAMAGSDGAIYHDGGRVGRFSSGGIANLPQHDRIVLPRGYDDGGTVPDFGDRFAGNDSFDDRFNEVYQMPAKPVTTIPISGPAGAPAPTPRPRPEVLLADGIDGGIDGGIANRHRDLPPSAMGYADDDDALPPHATPASGVAPPMLSHIPDSAPVQPAAAAAPRNDIGPALMQAGLSLMANKSPFLGVALGEAGQAGLGAYEGSQKLAKEQDFTQTRIDLEAKKLAQEAEFQHQRLANETRPYDQMTAAQKASHDENIRYHDLMAGRMQLRPTNMQTEDGHPIMYDQRTGRNIDVISGEPVDEGAKIHPFQPAGRPGGIQTLAQALMADRERQRAENPALPSLGLEEATNLAHRYRMLTRTLFERLNLAQAGWKAWTSNPSNYGKNAPEASLDFWEKRFGVSPSAPGESPAAGAQPGAPGGGPAAATAPAPNVTPPRPASVPADAQPQRNKATGAIWWLAPDGTVYSADGARQ